MTNTVTAVKIDVNGQATIVELQADGQGVGKAFREALDCRNFDVVRLAPGLDMWIDDEGAVHGRSGSQPRRDPHCQVLRPPLAALCGNGGVRLQ